MHNIYKTTSLVLVLMLLIMILSNQKLEAKKKDNKEESVSTFVISPDINIENDEPDGGGAITYEEMNLNQIYDITLEPLAFDAYSYLMTSNGYYVIETTGTSNTKLEITFEDYSNLDDDDSGVGNNARIEFTGKMNTKVYIKVSLVNASSNETFKLQIRKQKFSMFAYDEPWYQKMTHDLIKPYNLFNNLYDCTKYENSAVTRANILSNDERNLCKLNSEIVFYSGHGSASGLVTKTSPIVSTDVIDMSNTKVALWASCESGSNANSLNMSFAEYTVTKGAKCAVGFKYVTFAPSSSVFTCEFFEQLSEGKTVEEACLKASQKIIFWFDTVKDYVIFGDKNTTIVTSSTSSASYTARNTINYNAILGELTLNYESHNISGNVYRYYKKINEYITTDYVDLTFEGGNVVAVDENRIGYSEILEINEEYLNTASPSSITIEGETYLKSEELSRNIIYYNFNNCMTPILIIGTSYVNGSYKFCDMYCINLNSGDNINYEDICFTE